MVVSEVVEYVIKLKLARVTEDEVAPNRNPPPVEDVITAAAVAPIEAPADAAE